MTGAFTATGHTSSGTILLSAAFNSSNDARSGLRSSRRYLQSCLTSNRPYTTTASTETANAVACISLGDGHGFGGSRQMKLMKSLNIDPTQRPNHVTKCELSYPSLWATFGNKSIITALT